MKTGLPNALGQTIFKAIAFATSVAVIVLNVLNTAAPATLITLLAIGLFCLAILQFQKS